MINKLKYKNQYLMILNFLAYLNLYTLRRYWNYVYFAPIYRNLILNRGQAVCKKSYVTL